MKKFSVLALVLAFTMMLSIVSFAADPTFSVVENADVETDGSVIPEGTTVTPAADSIAVTTTATAGNYYGILLVEGDALPTVDNAILYINQATAADVEQAFTVLPIIPEVGTELTLYISSNVAGAELIAIPMIYDAEEDVIVPDPTVYTVGDVDGNGSITIGDVTTLIDKVLEKITYFTDAEGAVLPLLVGDVDNNASITIGDVTTAIDRVLEKITSFEKETYELAAGVTPESTYAE